MKNTLLSGFNIISMPYILKSVINLIIPNKFVYY